MLIIYYFTPDFEALLSTVSGDEREILENIRTFSKDSIKIKCDNKGGKERETDSRQFGFPLTKGEFQDSFGHLSREVPPRGLFLSYITFDDEFCSKLRRIAQETDLKNHILNNVIHDKKFMNHPIGIGLLIIDGETTEIPNPIGTWTRRLENLVTKSPLGHMGAAKKVLTTGGFILIAIGLAIWILKSSMDLELFGPLK